MKIVTQRLILRELIADDITIKYVNWLNDPDVNQYLESRFTKHTLSSLNCFFHNLQNDSSPLIFAIIVEANEQHIKNWTYR